MNFIKVGALLLTLLGFYYAFTKIPAKRVASSTTASNDTLSICGPASTMYRLPYSVELPQVQDIPGSNNEDSLVLYLQNAADSFSWRTFIALNWPATAGGLPDSNQCFASNNAPTTVWQTWMPSTSIFKSNNGLPEPWPDDKRAIKPLRAGLEVHEMRTSKIDTEFTIFDAEQKPVVDARHMYTLYENFFNRSAYDYIVNGKLYSKAGQNSFVKNWPLLTKGFYAIKGADTLNIAARFQRAYFSVGNNKDSIEMKPNLVYNDTSTYTLHFKTDPGAAIIKSAWVVLVPGKDDQSKYLTRTIWVKSGKETKKRMLGLVGMHIMHKVAEQTQWVWSSFEHINNAPLMDNRGNAILEPGKDYLYFDQKKNKNNLYNKPPKAKFEPNPFKRNLSQIVQVRGPQQSTELINVYFHNQIRRTDKSSKWLNYRLIGTQWALKTDLFTAGNDYKPAFLANPVLEAYIQTSSSCMGCHKEARFLQDTGKGSRGYNADFVWELANVK